MPANPPEGMPRITPYLYYEDLPPILEWLAEAFGFRETLRIPGPDGKIVHAEMALADGVIMMGYPGPEFQNPKRHGHINQVQYVYVDDIDKHHAHALEVGAAVLSTPEDQFYGDRTYRVTDPEGHEWTFAQHVRDVPPEELQQHQ